MSTAICAIPGCGRPIAHRGWCDAHYLRWLRHGDPLKGGPTRSSKGEPLRCLKEVVLAYDGDSCLTWPYARYGSGYAQIKIDGKNALVSRLVCEEIHGPPPTPEHQAAHSCGKGHFGCVTKRHLSWKTRAENEADKLIHGTHSRGAQHGAAKLTEGDVRAIRALSETMIQRQIGERFGIARPTVSKILTRSKWAHI